jgi:polysaccharide deacetylase family protein (PEP-CTERM system associated)
VAEKQHLLTIALEDYFQVQAFHNLIPQGQWYRFETRLESNTHKALALLDRFGMRATFFVTGWIGDQYPELVRMVAERGHEIASQGYYHKSVRQMEPAEFRDDLARAREALERAAGTRVLGHRVARRWFAPRDLWALEVLAKEGYAYDASVGPLFRRFASEPWRRFQHRLRFGERELWEFPVPTSSVLGWHFPIGGGNYYRQFPHRFMKRAVEHWHQSYTAPFVMYFHLWELDPEQPKIKAASMLTRIRHYRNLGKMPWVLEDYFSRYRFTSIADYLGIRNQESGNRGQGSGVGDQGSETQVALSSQGSAVRVFAPGYSSLTADPRSLPSVSSLTPDPRHLTPVPVSVVVPCCNEELILPYLANTLRRVQASLAESYRLQFVFVDDGSADGTWSALHTLFGQWPNTTILRHERNRGVAAAIRTGISQAATEIVCSIDCDCTYDPHELGAMIPLLTDGVDLVTASPYHPQGHVRNVPAWRLSLSRTASFLYRRVLRQKLFTYTSCFRVYRRSAVLDLDVRENGYLGIAETLAQLDRAGSTIVEYPATLEVRLLGRSKLKIYRTILGHLRLIARLLAMKIYQPPVRKAHDPASPAASDRVTAPDKAHAQRTTA